MWANLVVCCSPGWFRFQLRSGVVTESEVHQVVVAETPCRNSCSVWKPRRPPKSWFKLRASSNFSISGWWFGTCFPYFGNNHPNWLSYFSEGLKPPTRYFSRIYLLMLLRFTVKFVSGPGSAASSRAPGLSVGAAPWRGVVCPMPAFQMLMLLRGSRCGWALMAEMWVYLKIG